MTTAKIGVWAGAAIMAMAIAYGFSAGNGWSEVATLVGYAWFNVSLVDVFVGFALFAGWIVYRERCPWVIAVWIVAIVLLGNLVTCLYAALAMRRSGGDWTAFWLGTRAA